MLLADHEIKGLLADPEAGLAISDFEERRLKGASYDLLVGKRILISGQYKEIGRSIWRRRRRFSYLPATSPLWLPTNG
jgi:hypothetical protein